MYQPLLSDLQCIDKPCKTNHSGGRATMGEQDFKRMSDNSLRRFCLLRTGCTWLVCKKKIHSSRSQYRNRRTSRLRLAAGHARWRGLKTCILLTICVILQRNNLKPAASKRRKTYTPVSKSPSQAPNLHQSPCLLNHPAPGSISFLANGNESDLDDFSISNIRC